MYLFTTPPATTRETSASRDTVARGAANAGVVDAIREGAQTSGAGFDYLLATAKRESGLDPSAKAGTSSATGLFQFIEQTWLGVMKNAGPKLGLSTYADAITARSDGTYTVQDPAARQSILDLRRDPTIAATMAGALTQANRDSLGAALGREPTSGDLYAAHVLGARGAASLINTAQVSPARAAALDMPEAAAANRSLFYDKAGRPRGAAELYALLSTSQKTGPVSASPAASSVTDLPSGATAYASLDGGGLRSMFQTDRRQGAVSDGVARLWQGRGAAEAARSAPSYFPRSDQAATRSEPAEAAAVPAAPETAMVSVALVGSPLPPRRPAEFAAPVSRQAGALVPSLYTTRSGP
ncbi:MAG: lytic transglycosylase domain-containing protein [Methylobacterium sp.]|uniref:lytic transglycosylase domain-containing protein n=1 Tax=Methylobacterium sp. TaxID=409 RepID=UPI0025D6534D|nr:lytic transglycosylase domain-containing protein [Methylobacterium sp.]MBX9933911.1 lytic transglycosylase domain-containing protein [Methylobacterium sp.]